MGELGVGVGGGFNPIVYGLALRSAIPHRIHSPVILVHPCRYQITAKEKGPIYRF